MTHMTEGAAKLTDKNNDKKEEETLQGSMQKQVTLTVLTSTPKHQSVLCSFREIGFLPHLLLQW